MTRIDKDLRATLAVTRFGLGARPGEIDEARSDPEGWLQTQIRTNGADQPVASTGAPLPSGQERFQAFLGHRNAVGAAGADPAARKILAQTFADSCLPELLSRMWLATQTSAGFQERWVLFWSNHFTVSSKKGEPLMATAAAFEREAIRPHVFGRFADMLLASTRHPAMLMYLDQVQSIGSDSPAGLRRRKMGVEVGLNENLGREVMELHTLGAASGYTQQDVTEFSRALTGWSMGGANAPPAQRGAFLYRPDFHEPGQRSILGRRYEDAGEGQAATILTDLAAHPATAAHLAHRLATHFVADTPPPALVERLRRAYLAGGGDLSRVAVALIEAPEAWAPEALKLKTPYDYLVSAYRAAGAGPKDARREVVGPLAALGQRPLSAPQPNGWSEVAQDWAAAGAIIDRLTWTQRFAATYTPSAEPLPLYASILGSRARPETAKTLSRAQSRQEAFAILLMTPEFQRR